MPVPILPPAPGGADFTSPAYADYRPGAYPGDSLGTPGINPNTVPDWERWIGNTFPIGGLADWLAGTTSHPPAPPRPMIKGQPQAPASEGAGSSEQQSKAILRDVIIYAGLALAVLVGITVALR